MGTFASCFYSRGAHMPEEKVHEFQDRLEKLFQAGGMMESEAQAAVADGLVYNQKKGP